jgi:hypothetical protein
VNADVDIPEVLYQIGKRDEESTRSYDLLRDRISMSQARKEGKYGTYSDHETETRL